MFCTRCSWSTRTTWSLIRPPSPSGRAGPGWTGSGSCSRVWRILTLTWRNLVRVCWCSRVSPARSCFAAWRRYFTIWWHFVNNWIPVGLEISFWKLFWARYVFNLFNLDGTVLCLNLSNGSILHSWTHSCIWLLKIMNSLISLGLILCCRFFVVH